MDYQTLHKYTHWSATQSHWDALAWLVENPEKAEGVPWDLLQLVLDKQLFLLGVEMKNNQFTLQFDTLQLLFSLRLKQALNALNSSRQMKQGIFVESDFRAKPYHRYHALSEMEVFISTEYTELLPHIVQKVLEDTQLALLEDYAVRLSRPSADIFDMIALLSFKDQTLEAAWNEVKSSINSSDPESLAAHVLEYAVNPESKVSAFSVLAHLNVLSEYKPLILEQLFMPKTPAILKEKIILSRPDANELLCELLLSSKHQALHAVLISVLKEHPTPQFLKILETGLETLNWENEIRLMAYYCLVKQGRNQGLDDILMMFQMGLKQGDLNFVSKVLDVLAYFSDSQPYLKSALKTLSIDPMDKILTTFSNEQSVLVSKIKSILSAF